MPTKVNARTTGTIKIRQKGRFLKKEKPLSRNQQRLQRAVALSEKMGQKIAENSMTFDPADLLCQSRVAGGDY